MLAGLLLFLELGLDQLIVIYLSINVCDFCFWLVFIIVFLDWLLCRRLGFDAVVKTELDLRAERRLWDVGLERR